MRTNQKDFWDKEQRKIHYNSTDINDKLIINFRDLNHTIRSLYEGKGSQKRILIILNEVENITQHMLTKRLGIQPGSASEVLAKLEKNGLIIRSLSETDRRTADITLTQEGRRIANDALEQRKYRHEEMFSCLSDEEKNSLLSLLEKINEDWEERYQGMKERKSGKKGKKLNKE